MGAQDQEVALAKWLRSGSSLYKLVGMFLSQPWPYIKAGTEGDATSEGSRTAKLRVHQLGTLRAQHGGSAM